VIFIDTGAFLAYYRENDQYHQKARARWRALGVQAVTNNHVIDETATGLARLAGYEFACACVSAIFDTPKIEIVYSTSEDEREGLQWMRKYADQSVSFTDCVSFAIMRRLRIRTVFTFDRHFRLAGFDVVG
jgi:uncharacterized protein